MNRMRSQGFTLIELSLVLVIIGLIVGGILGGRELIRSAQKRRIVGDVEATATAVNAFRLKYNGVPGDLTRPEEFGFIEGTCIPRGNGDGLIGTAGAVPYLCTDIAHCEPSTLWFHLRKSNLLPTTLYAYLMPGRSLDDYICNTINYPSSNYAFLSTAYIGTYLPSTQRNIFFDYVQFSGMNYIRLITSSRDTASSECGTDTGGTEITYCNSMSAADAFYIDTKLDDGLPMSGNVRASQGYSWDTKPFGFQNNPTSGAFASSACVNSGVTPPAYNVAGSRVLMCNLYLSAGF